MAADDRDGREPFPSLRAGWTYLVDSMGIAGASLHAHEEALDFLDHRQCRRAHAGTSRPAVASFLARCRIGWDRLLRELARRHTIAILKRLDDATLRDIGFESRDMIDPALRVQADRRF
ncbi:DUF1127 domain-containing protein [Ancylobacter oerskovii]|uniref:DUF1127 domain-containing protein n=1 Tax=Ancylobacter oerskovii TaxID=459519 RepID=A0ABW4YVP5_9HYPH|nr:DUF1127 domain-containing protein [Ancylobacter oerskovii]MBS7544188.1 DUF1127 domain-containing protein [Ancylobacter oerskovii]